MTVVSDEGALVLRVCCQISFWWPLVVAGDLGKCLRTNSGVNPGNVAKNPLVIASIHVFGTGLHDDWWWYFARLTFVLIAYTLLLVCTWFGDVFGCMVSFGFIGVRYRPVVRSRVPTMSTVLVLLIASTFVKYDAVACVTQLANGEKRAVR